MRLAQEIGLDAAARSDLFYALLLKDAGCSANSARMAALFGADDHDRQAHVQARRLVREAAGADVVAADGRPRRLAARPRPAAEGDQGRGRGDALADAGALRPRRRDRAPDRADGRDREGDPRLDEHWDGRGQPRGLRGEEIPLLARIVCLAQTVEIFHAAGGVEAAWSMARKRSGGWFDPALVDTLGALPARRRVLGLARGPRRLGRGSPRTGCCTPATPASIASRSPSPA